MSRRRYAEGTNVSVEKSRAELGAILSRYGVERQGWMTGPEGDQLAFVIRGRSYRLEVVRPSPSEVRSARPGSYLDTDRLMDDEWKRRWRALVLLVKAKCEFAEGDASTIEREFMPYLLTSGGQTIADIVESSEPQSVSPALLLGSGS